MALQDLAFVPEGQIELDAFRNLLVSAWESFDPLRNKSEQTLTTNFRRAVRIYDWLLWAAARMAHELGGLKSACSN